jgi:lipoyl(octanoyl) transferase
VRFLRPVSGFAEAPTPHSLPGRALRAYLLGTVGFDGLLALQRRLVYDVSGDRTTAALIVCDHPPGITIGREGSRLHVRLSPEELAAREWGVRWVARGGGVMLHAPGQVAAYPLLPLDESGLTPAAFARRLSEVAAEVASGFGVPAAVPPDRPGVRVGDRAIAHVGLAVRNWVGSFGLVLNVNPDLELFRGVWCDGDPAPMTSLLRESPHRVRVQAVRQQLVERIAARFGYDRVSVFHTHPAVPAGPPSHAHPARHYSS